MDSPVTVPAEAVLAVTAQQRNDLMDELAKAHVIIGQVVAERDKLAEQLRARDSSEDDAEQPTA
ncbi:hypothetical protein [Nonomuraea sp. NPDC050786]|uniref:hypothetical protein n=1 Tax=Nonomuraea sp. NPDC050786 TaxID=3154840 RepID=UPI0033D6A2F8